MNREERRQLMIEGGQSPARGQPAPPAVPQPAPQQAAPQQAAPPPTQGGFDPSMLEQPAQGIPQPGTPVEPPAEEPAFLRQMAAGAVDSLSFLNPFSDMADEAQEGDGAGAFTGAMGDWGSFGTMDAMKAAEEATKQWMLTGADWSDTYANEKEQVNAALALNSAEYPTQALGGAITGGILGGAGPASVAEKATRGLGWMARAALVTPATAAGEAALYRYNSDGTKQEIMTDAGLAATVGLVLGSGAGIVGNRLRAITGKNTSATEAIAAKQLLDAINLKNTKRGQAPVSADQLNALFKERGMEAVMADYYPEMAPLLQRAVAVPGSDGAKNAVALLGARNELEGSFGQVIDDVISIPKSRSVEEYKRYTQQLNRELSPQYNTVLDKAEAQGINFKPKGLLKSIQTSYDDLPVGDIGQQKAAVKSLAKLLRPKTKDGKISMRALHNAKQEFYAANKNNPAAGRAYDMVTDWLGQVDPEYNKLSRVFSHRTKVSKAYETGYKYFQGKKQAPGDIRSMADSFGTYGEASAFANGARRKLAEELRGASPQQVEKKLLENQDKIDMLRIAIGPERTDKLLGAVLAETSAEKTRQLIEKSVSAIGKPGPGGDKVRQQMSDAAVALASPGRSPGKVRAVLNTWLPQDVQAPDTAANIYGRIGTAPLEEQPALLKELQRMAAQKGGPGQMARSVRTGAGIGAGTTEATRDIESYLDQLPE